MAKNDIITIEFHGHQLETFKSAGQEWVSIVSLCKGMGLDVWAQQRKLQKKQEKFNYSLKAMVAQDGKTREVQCIPVKKVPGWLFTVDADRVKPEVKPTVELFQAECFDVLYDYWHGSEPNPAITEQPGQQMALLDKNLKHYWISTNSRGETVRNVPLTAACKLVPLVDEYFNDALLMRRADMLDFMDEAIHTVWEMDKRLQGLFAPMRRAMDANIA